MNRSVLRLLAFGIVLVLLMTGCSDHPSQFMAPQQPQSSGAQAPLLNKVAGADYVDGAYIVVFKDAVADVNN